MKYTASFLATFLGVFALCIGCASEDPRAVAPSVPTTASGTRGVSQGGAQDIARFREIVAQGQIPSPDTLEATGFFAEHAFDLPPATCGSVVCLNPSLAVAPRFDNSNWTMGFVTLSTAVDPATLPRPPLHLVVAVTTADHSYGYARGLAALVGGLRPEDRVSVVVARSPSSFPTIALHGVAPNDPRLAMLGTPYDSGAVYESLVEASAAIETLPGFSGVSRILLVTSGPRSPRVTEPRAGGGSRRSARATRRGCVGHRRWGQLPRRRARRDRLARCGYLLLRTK